MHDSTGDAALGQIAGLARPWSGRESGVRYCKPSTMANGLTPGYQMAEVQGSIRVSVLTIEGPDKLNRLVRDSIRVLTPETDGKK